MDYIAGERKQGKGGMRLKYYFREVKNHRIMYIKQFLISSNICLDDKSYDIVFPFLSKLLAVLYNGANLAGTQPNLKSTATSNVYSLKAL